jgi:hypothetical protein
MRDTMKPLRKAIFDCLGTNVKYPGVNVVPVMDEKVIGGTQPNVYILLSTQRERDVTDQDCYWQTESSIDILIIAKSGAEVSKDSIDDISQRIYSLLLNLPGDQLIQQQTGFQILEFKRVSAVSGSVQISPTQSELQKILSLTANIFHS